MKTLANKKILITGANGFLGTHLVKHLKEIGVEIKNLFTPSSHDFDLRLAKNCQQITKDMDIVIHLAANVGGIGYNQKFPGQLFYDNAVMGIHLMEEARKSGVDKFVALGTVCAYPKFTPVPFKEESLWDGYPEETNAPYGLAKKMLLVQAQAYRQQYGMNAIYLLPVNLYGPGDNFNPKSSHVIPALIRKFVEAKQENKAEVVVWGTGKATREFLYVKDAARAIALATLKYNEAEPVNIGSAHDISIANLAKLIAKLVDFKGKIVFDTTKPDGQPKRKLDTSKAKDKFSFESTTNFEQGLEETIDWYYQQSRD